MCEPCYADKPSSKGRQFCCVKGCGNSGEESLLRTGETEVVCGTHFDNFRNQWLFSENCSLKCLRENPHSRCEHTQCCSYDCGELGQHSVWTRNSAGMPITALACEKHAVPRYVAPIVYCIPGIGYAVFYLFHC
jgi:hypothetical protein